MAKALKLSIVIAAVMLVASGVLYAWLSAPPARTTYAPARAADIDFNPPVVPVRNAAP